MITSLTEKKGGLVLIGVVVSLYHCLSLFLMPFLFFVLGLVVSYLVIVLDRRL